MLGRLDQPKFVDWKSKRKKVHRMTSSSLAKAPRERDFVSGN